MAYGPYVTWPEIGLCARPGRPRLLDKEAGELSPVPARSRGPCTIIRNGLLRYLVGGLIGESSGEDEHDLVLIWWHRSTERCSPASPPAAVDTGRGVLTRLTLGALETYRSLTRAFAVPGAENCALIPSAEGPRLRVSDLPGAVMFQEGDHRHG
jgi:hypothetical protein